MSKTIAFQPARLGKLDLKNRIMNAATFEGEATDGIRCIFGVEAIT